MGSQFSQNTPYLTTLPDYDDQNYLMHYLIFYSNIHRYSSVFIEYNDARILVISKTAAYNIYYKTYSEIL